MSQIILNKPSDIYAFGAEYFKSLSSPEENVVVICGPSGVGKGTILKQIFHTYKDKMALSVSHTTRSPRENEVDSVHYFYVSKEEFQSNIDKGDFFIEYAHVHDNIYGTSFKGIDAVLSQNKICVLEIDVQGAQLVIQKLQTRPKIMYVAPPSLEILKERLLGRGSETEESIRTRLENAKEEIEWCENSGECDATIVNDSLDKAVKEVREQLEQWFPSLTSK